MAVFIQTLFLAITYLQGQQLITNATNQYQLEPTAGTKLYGFTTNTTIPYSIQLSTGPTKGCAQTVI